MNDHIVIDNENRAPLLGHTSLLLGQDAEKARQLRSRLIEILNVPQRVRLRFRLACGLAGRPF